MTMKGFTYDSKIATMCLAVAGLFIASASFVVTILPYLVFTAVVGWQSTHVSILIGVVSLVSAGPGLAALLGAGRRQMSEGGLPAHSIGRFWKDYATAWRTLIIWWVGLAVFGVALGYDLALFGDSDVVFVAGVGVLTMGFLATVAVAGSLQSTDRGVRLVVAALAGLVRRPHIAIVWLLLTVAAGLLVAIPVVGPSLTLFIPAVWSMGIAVAPLTKMSEGRVKLAGNSIER